MTEWQIACERCGTVQETTTHLMERVAAIREAKEVRARLEATPEERTRRAAPDLLAELEALVNAIALQRQADGAWQSMLYRSTRGDPISDEEFKSATDARENANAGLVLRESTARAAIEKARGE